MTTPLNVLDLVPISSRSTAAQALRNSIDLARHAEALGYTRYWFAEHHLNPGVAGTSPAVLLALTAAQTSTIRLGSGAVQMGHRTALSTVEEFGLLDALHPGRFDLGLGRSGGKPLEPASSVPAPATSRAVTNGRAPNGLLIPPRFDVTPLLKSPRFALHKALLQLPGAQSQDYTEQVDDILALIADTYRSDDGEEAHVVPGGGADLQVWILGSSGGQSAVVADNTGLRFGLQSTLTGPTSPSRLTSSSPRMRPPLVTWLQVTGPGCAASAPVKERSRFPLPTKRAATPGPMPTANLSRIGSRPNSSDLLSR